MKEQDQISPESYEPLPDLHAMPVWLWRRAPRSARAAFVAALLLAAGAATALAPAIEESKRERAREQAAELRAAQARRTRALRAEQRPVSGRAAGAAPADASPPVRLASRARLLAELQAQMLADARARRLTGRPRRVNCAPFPRQLDDRDPRRDLRLRWGRYACLVATAEIAANARNVAGAIGHPYRALIDFQTGRYAFCKISPVPAEGALSAERPVTVPAACGGA